MRKGTSEKPAVILTIGHSIHTLEVFIRLLCAHEVKHVVDVRTVPRSRRNPQFNRETLPDSLKAVGIRYTHMAKPLNDAFRHPMFGESGRGWRRPPSPAM